MSDHVEDIGSGGGRGSMDLSRCFLMYANLTRAYAYVCVCVSVEEMRALLLRMMQRHEEMI